MAAPPAATARRRRLLLPAALGAMGVLLAVKVATLAAPPPGAGGADRAPALVGSARASEAPGGAAKAPPASADASGQRPAAPGGEGSRPEAPHPSGPDQHHAATPEQRAERELLQALRARRAELDAREQALLTREVAAEAAERRAAQRLEELWSLQRQTAAAGAAERERSERERERAEREEAGWRQMVKLYEGMRPREAAAIFDDLELPVLVPLVDRLREAKAAPILGAMRPDRARALTSELARHRAVRGARG